MQNIEKKIRLKCKALNECKMKSDRLPPSSSFNFDGKSKEKKKEEKCPAFKVWKIEVNRLFRANVLFEVTIKFF